VKSVQQNVVSNDDHLILYEAGTNPKAQTGADLLDIGGKVRDIGVISAQDGMTELATITDPEQVAETQAVIVIASMAINEFRATIRPWTEGPGSGPLAVRELKTESKRVINKTVFTLGSLGKVDDLLLEVTFTYYQGSASYYWRLNPSEE